MATGRLPDPNTAPVTAKGDLYTYSTVPAKLAVGNDGETLVADSAATTGLRWSGTPSASNPVINGAFDIWQRGTSFTGSGLTADRWQTGSTANKTVSRQATGDTTNLPFIQYSLRIQRTNGTTTTGGMDIGQSFETVNSIPFAGKTVTLSFYARRGANYSPTSNLLDVYLLSGTGTDQNIYSGLTGVTNVILQSATLTTTWQRFSYTGTIASTATQIAPYFLMNPTGTAGANDWFEVTGVQIDIGSVALPFRRTGGTLAGELAACQRYYQRITSDQAYGTFGSGHLKSTTTAEIAVPLITTLRTTVASVSSSGTFGVSSGADFLSTSTLASGSSNTKMINVQFTVSGATAGRGCVLVANNSTTVYLEASAEL